MINHAAAPEEAVSPGKEAAGEETKEEAPAAEPKLATYALRIKSPEVGRACLQLQQLQQFEVAVLNLPLLLLQVLDQFITAVNANKAGAKAAD